MADDTSSRTAGEAKERQRARLAAKLRANLQRRKNQARSRRSGEADERPEGLPSAPTPEADRDA